MIKIKFSICPFIKVFKSLKDKKDEEKGGSVGIHIRWNDCKQELRIFTSVYANTGKWDSELRRAKRNSTHTVLGQTYSASEINEEIGEYREVIQSIFEECSLRNTIPTVKELKEKVYKILGRTDDMVVVEVKQRYTLDNLFKLFIEENTREKNWNYRVLEKYNQAIMHFKKANPDVTTPYHITLEHMYNLREWFVSNGYKNRTINMQVTILKSIFRWFNNQDGVTIPSQVLDFETNLKVLRKTVTFLHYDELLHFAHFDFKGNRRLERARDYWCFMAFTSLRISDLCALKTSDIQNGHIMRKAIKTGETLIIPLVDEAKAIMERHKDDVTTGNRVFDIPSTQKLNDAVKDAARAAGLDREIVDTYYVGTQRIEKVHKFHEIISNHDGRRTFVSCSLAMGIPPEVVMKSTGHRSYDTMKPYIETATETQDLEMEKWNRNQYRSQILQILEGADDDILRDFLEYAKKTV